MIRKYAEIFCWKNVSSFCSTHIFSAKIIRILYIESTKTVNEMTLNKLVKLTTLWTTGPWISNYQQLCQNVTFKHSIHALKSTVTGCNVLPISELGFKDKHSLKQWGQDCCKIRLLLTAWRIAFIYNKVRWKWTEPPDQKRDLVTMATVAVPSDHGCCYSFM